MQQTTARKAILGVAFVYIVILGLVELFGKAAALDAITQGELMQKATTLASLCVGTILGFYIASMRPES